MALNMQHIVSGRYHPVFVGDLYQKHNTDSFKEVETNIISLREGYIMRRGVGIKIKKKKKKHCKGFS